MKALIATSTTDFDPTEVAVPWKILRDAGVDVTFATDTGEMGAADEHMLKGEYFGVLRPLLIARKDARKIYAEMLESPEFQNPISYDDIRVEDYDGLLLPGGHAAGIMAYLESEVLQSAIVGFFKADKPVGAICHGVVAAARAIDPDTGKSVLYGRITTALHKVQEKTAHKLTQRIMGDYYLTYPTPVEDEVVAALKQRKDFRWTQTPVLRDSPKKLKRGFTVRDGNYISARWPGDAYRFGTEFLEMLMGSS